MDRAIMLFPGGKSKAFTMSYDDGMDFDRQLVDMCRAHGVKCTFNLNSNRLGMPGHRYLSPDEIKDIYTPDAAEVAVHGKDHAFLTMIPAHAVALEMLQDRIFLENIMGEVIRGCAYPFGFIDDTVLDIMRNATGLAYARTIKSTKDFAIPTDWMQWDPTCHHDDPELMELADKFINRPAFFGASLFYVWGHSYEFGFKNNWNVMEELLDKVSGNPEVWYASNIEICDYVEAYKQLKWSADCKMVYNPTNTEIWFAIGQWPRRDNEPQCIKPGQTLRVKGWGLEE